MLDLSFEPSLDDQNSTTQLTNRNLIFILPDTVDVNYRFYE